MKPFSPMRTFYKGRWFRSTIEARYAVLFDACGFVWEYEPQPFNLPKCGPYLPDFRVRTCGRISRAIPGDGKSLLRFEGNKAAMPDGWLYVEVKHDLLDADLSKVSEFSSYRDAIACGRFVEIEHFAGEVHYGVQLLALGDDDMMENYGLQDTAENEGYWPWLGMKDGLLGVCFPDQNQEEFALPDRAYLRAMNYQFDHRAPA